MADRMALAVAERSDFADFLESLSPEQWQRLTLCEGCDGARHQLRGSSTSRTRWRVLIHHQDIRRPLGLHREIRGERVKEALDQLDGPGHDILRTRVQAA